MFPLRLVITVAILVSGCERRSLSPKATSATPTREAPAATAGSLSGAIQRLPPDPFSQSDVADADVPLFGPVGWGLSNSPASDAAPLPRAVKEALYRDAVEVVDLHYVALSPEMKSHIARFRRVKWLRMSANFTASDVQWLGQLEQLRGLSLAHADMTGVDFQALAPLQSLQWFNLYYAKITGSDFKTLPVLPSLHTLWLGGDHMGDEFITHLVELQLPSLRVLVLYNSSVTDKGVEELASSYDLEELHLHACERVTERSIPSISKMKKLRLLGIGFTGISPQCTKNQAVERLQQLLPTCVVDYSS